MARPAIEASNDVRNAFTANFLDPSMVHVSIDAGKVVLSGRIKRLAGCYAPVTTNTLTSLELSIIHVPEIRYIRWSLDNWSNESGTWQMVKARRKTL